MAAQGADSPSLSPRARCLQAARAAEARHGLPEGLLVAVALAESGLHAYALNIGGRSHFAPDAATAHRLVASAPAQASIMAGCVQVNARVHAPRSDWPLDPVRATNWAAEHLRDYYNRSGDWAEAIRRWNGGSTSTANRLVCRVRAKLQVVSPGAIFLNGPACGQAETNRVARNGVALLEVAEAEAR
ncbi:transglycosylase SLT domain-containing protein [Humitalea rosea]|uniref:transglycosylase SLT domain-containing protein n=1 Tax=Humitalea rosea TaxID=990373 RepID=UPI0024828E78|nr:transglycosylase SLT domain-containing protein [Humitalea rosea]